jgi:energy-coupling factor transporter ATP-binding protein EcfA2
VLKKNATLVKSNVLQSLMKKSINEEIAISPYTLEMQKQGLKVKAIK